MQLRQRKQDTQQQHFFFFECFSFTFLCFFDGFSFLLISTGTNSSLSSGLEVYSGEIGGGVCIGPVTVYAGGASYSDRAL